MSREPSFDELIDAEMTGAERQRLEHVHDLLLQAGPPPELPPELRQAPNFGVVPLKLRRRVVKRRALVLLAAAVAVAAVFAAGYGVGNRGGSKSAVRTFALQGTRFAPKAQATLEVWHFRDGNLPMTLQVEGLRKLPPRSYYDVYLVRSGRVEPWGLCGSFRVGSPSRAVTLNFSAPYPVQKGDSWVVTRPGPDGKEPGKVVLRPAVTT